MSFFRDHGHELLEGLMDKARIKENLALQRLWQDKKNAAKAQKQKEPDPDPGQEAGHEFKSEVSLLKDFADKLFKIQMKRQPSKNYAVLQVEVDMVISAMVHSGFTYDRLSRLFAFDIKCNRNKNRGYSRSEINKGLNDNYAIYGPDDIRLNDVIELLVDYFCKITKEATASLPAPSRSTAAPPPAPAPAPVPVPVPVQAGPRGRQPSRDRPPPPDVNDEIVVLEEDAHDDENRDLFEPRLSRSRSPPRQFKQHYHQMGRNASPPTDPVGKDREARENIYKQLSQPPPPPPETPLSSILAQFMAESDQERSNVYSTRHQQQVQDDDDDIMIIEPEVSRPQARAPMPSTSQVQQVHQEVPREQPQQMVAKFFPYHILVNKQSLLMAKFRRLPEWMSRDMNNRRSTLSKLSNFVVEKMYPATRQSGWTHSQVLMFGEYVISLCALKFYNHDKLKELYDNGNFREAFGMALKTLEADNLIIPDFNHAKIAELIYTYFDSGYYSQKIQVLGNFRA